MSQTSASRPVSSENTIVSDEDRGGYITDCFDADSGNSGQENSYQTVSTDEDSKGVKPPTKDSLIKFLTHNPGYFHSALQTMQYCSTQRAREDVANFLDSLKRPKTATQTSQQIIFMLIVAGGLHQSIYVDDELYVGDEQSLSDDDSISGDAQIDYYVQLTEIGTQVLTENDPTKKITELFAEKHQHKQAFSQVLKACMSRPMKQSEVEDIFTGDDDALKVDPGKGLPQVYPAYFTGALEEAGALVWEGAWHITQEGKGFLRQLSL